MEQILEELKQIKELLILAIYLSKSSLSKNGLVPPSIG